MRALLVFIVAGMTVALTGCAVTPMRYNVDNPRISKPTVTSDSYDALEVGDFHYQPPAELGQFDVSVFGCLPCRNDGGYSNLKYSTSIKDIVGTEVRNVLNEIQKPGAPKICSISGTVNLAGFSIGNGEQSLDITYSLIKNKRELVRQRLQEKNYDGLFSGQPFNRLFERVTQKSLQNFLMSKATSQAYKEHCK